MKLYVQTVYNIQFKMTNDDQQDQFRFIYYISHIARKIVRVVK